MAAATLSIFSAGSVMAAGNGDFYPQPVNSDWEDAHTEGAYASFTNGSDYVNIYKYALDDAKIGVALNLDLKMTALADKILRLHFLSI